MAHRKRRRREEERRAEHGQRARVGWRGGTAAGGEGLAVGWLAEGRRAAVAEKRERERERESPSLISDGFACPSLILATEMKFRRSR